MLFVKARAVRKTKTVVVSNTLCRTSDTNVEGDGRGRGGFREGEAIPSAGGSGEPEREQCSDNGGTDGPTGCRGVGADARRNAHLGEREHQIGVQVPGREHLPPPDGEHRRRHRQVRRLQPVLRRSFRYLVL